jgi:hypothetical protein
VFTVLFIDRDLLRAGLRPGDASLYPSSGGVWTSGRHRRGGAQAFSVAGRPSCLYARLGSRARRQALVAEANDVLATLTFEGDGDASPPRSGPVGG